MLGIIIVNYKYSERTIAYINEEISKVQIPHRIVVVNNAATTESNIALTSNLNAELITDITLKPIESMCYVISHSDNLGYAKGNNLGVEFLLKHFYITHLLFSNNDIKFLDDDVVERLIIKIDLLPNVALIGPKVLGLDGENQSPEPYCSFWKKYIWMYWLTPFLSKNRKIRLFQMDYSQKATEGEHYKVMGSFFIVKAIDFIQCNMMDSNTFLYGEEVILSERLNKINKSAYYFPQVAILHEHGQIIDKYFNSMQSTNLQFTSDCYYYRTYRGISPLSIILAKLSMSCYIKLKSMFN